MKQAAILLIVFCMVAALTGCGSAPLATGTPAPTSSQIYTSEALGIDFTMPGSWAGKYRVVEGWGSLTVYFNPTQAPDPSVGDGELFCIVGKTADMDMAKYSNAREIDSFGTFIFGEPKDVRYQSSQPEYNTYVAMQRDLPSICNSVCSLPCKTYTIPK